MAILGALNTLNWNSLQWSFYAVYIGIMVGFIGNMLANAVAHQKEVNAVTKGISVDWKHEIKIWGTAFVIMLLFLLFLIYFWTPNVTIGTG
jgi:uncharacterized BrkB/YihY/UPF0761 family membrane protein